MTNMDKLYDSVAANGPVCVGLDTEIGYLPATDPAKTAGENVVEFNRAVIAATRGVAGCYKVQIAYYESLGLDGLRAYAQTLRMARATGLPVIADIKRGDIAKTAEMYAKAHFTGDFEADVRNNVPQDLPQNFTQDIIDFYNERVELSQKGYAVNDPFYSVVIDAETEYSTSLVELYKEYRDQLTMCAPEEFDALYDQLSQQYLDAGFQEVIDERTEAYNNGYSTKLPEIG